jgi:hypothetical protein
LTGGEKKILFLEVGWYFLVFIWANGYSHSPFPSIVICTGLFGAGMQQQHTHTHRLEPREDGRRTDNKMIPSTTPVNCFAGVNADLAAAMRRVDSFLSSLTLSITSASNVFLFFLSFYFGQLLSLWLLLLLLC